MESKLDKEGSEDKEELMGGKNMEGALHCVIMKLKTVSVEVLEQVSWKPKESGGSVSDFKALTVRHKSKLSPWRY